MLAIRTVVCPVDLSPASARQVDLAADICRLFGSRLVVHHNVTDLSVGAGVGWMWHADRTPSARTADERLRELIGRVPDAVTVEGCLTRGAATEAVHTVSDAADADLVVLSAHGSHDEDHASVTEYLLERSNRPVLVLHDAGVDRALPRFTLDGGESVAQSILVSTDLTGPSRAPVEFAFELARAVPVRLHLLYVQPNRGAPDDQGQAAATMRARLEALIPADLASRADAHVEIGDAVAGILALAERLGVACIVMGEHSRSLLRKWFTRDTSKEVLRRAPCPIWYVPSNLKT